MYTINLTDFKFWIIVCVQITGFIAVFFKLYTKAYIGEKGKNLATKEDIGEITQIVESIKNSLTIKTEEIKADLSYKNEHLIHLRASERDTIINYYKANWVMVLNFTKIDLIKYEIDYFDSVDDKVSYLDLNRYISEAEQMLNKIKEETSNLKYLRDISESELLFFYDEPELNSLLDELNLSLLEFERNLIVSINSLKQVFTEISVKINAGHLPKEIMIETKNKRSKIITKWYETRYNSLIIIQG